MTIPDEARPRLANGVRLQWEPAREAHLLLFPEGALRLNATAAAVLELCDGGHSVADIVASLSERYGGTDVSADVRTLLAAVAERGVVINVNE